MWFLIKEGILGFKNARMAVFLSIIAITISLFFNGIFFVSIAKVNDVAKSLKKQFYVQFFISPTARINIPELIEKIKKENVVLKIDYISPDSALKEMSASLDIPLEFIIDKNPLPPTLKVYIKESYVQKDFIRKFIDKYINSPTFINIQFPDKKLYFLEKYGIAILFVLIAVGILFLFSSILLITYTLKITIQSKQNYIVLTRLMGGTTFTIRFPFFVEGLLEGVLAATISVVLLVIFENILFQFNLPLNAFNHSLYGYIFVLGLLIGIIGSQIALKKYVMLHEELK